MARSVCFHLGGQGSKPFSDAFFPCPRNLILHGKHRAFNAANARADGGAVRAQ